MDRFKFRVWDKINEVWIKNPLLDTKRGCISRFYAPEAAMKRRIVVEQCIGLNDKHGNLIYEGDIVTDGEAVGVVKFDDKDLRYCVQAKGLIIVGSKWAQHFKIIGNVHENGGLINDTMA